MRLDKYLKVIRIIKRRTIACEICNAGKVSVNNKTAKASYEVKIGDEIEVKFGEKILKIKILKISEHVLKNDTKDCYMVLN